MSNGAQESPTSGTGSQGPGGAWIGLATLGSTIGLVASQYFPLVGGSGAEPWHADRLILIPLHVVLIGGLMGLAGWARGKSPQAAAASKRPEEPAPTEEPAPAEAQPQEEERPAPAPSKNDASTPLRTPAVSIVNLPNRPVADGDAKRNDAITAPPPRPPSIPPDGIPTAQRLEIAQMAALEEEEDRTLVGDLSELAKAQELAELQRMHREAKKAEQAKQAVKKGEK